MVHALLFTAAGILCYVTNSPLFLKLYPVLVNLLFLVLFAASLVFPPSLVFTIACQMDASIRGSLAARRIEAYCKRVTALWCVFIIGNGTAAAYTVFAGSDGVWALYNGGISYVLMGVLFAVEWVVRKKTAARMPRAVPLSRFTASSRRPDTIMCYEGRYSSAVYKTWGDFLTETAALRALVSRAGHSAWFLNSGDYWHFLTAFTALLQCGKSVILSATVTPEYISEIRSGEAALAGDTGIIPFLTDEEFPGIPGLIRIPAAPEKVTEVERNTTPSINPDKTVLVMYTSGTTGKPKPVRQRLTEFEADNAFILSKMGEEFLKRRLCSTVNQHHIYGLLFSIFLPFTAAVPFRRRRIEYPEEFEGLDDVSYMIITVPAFLKRSAELEKPGDLHLISPWIFTSGGVLPPETAKETNETFGFWPMEVYGSTETSGIAYRQSKDGPAWTPFDNCTIWLAGAESGNEGCLVVRSPYIKDPAGFTTGDLAEILPDGRFLLKGRADSIVKIEEKRVSLTEVESRLNQSGLVSDAAVVALEGRRQYLAAALSLNTAGKEQFAGKEKNEINRYFREYLAKFFESVVIPKRWRYVEALPRNSQGKIQKPWVKDLFAGEAAGLNAGHGIEGTILEQESRRALVELFISPESDYFDGHFPGDPIFPAAAQVDLVIRCAGHCFGTGEAVGARRLKFSAELKPGVRIRAELGCEPEGRIRFRLTDAVKPETIYASGILLFGSGA